MTDDIPADVHKYAESPIFTENTVPEKLTTLHDTKSGVWGRLCVLRQATSGLSALRSYIALR